MSEVLKGDDEVQMYQNMYLEFFQSKILGSNVAASNPKHGFGIFESKILV